MADQDLMQKIIALAKRRGFVFPGSEIYGGLANSWDYGSVGVELKNNIKQLWWKRFVHQRDDIVGIDAALMMNPQVWRASGHVSNFSDPLVEDKKTNKRYRLDHLLEEHGVNVSGMNLTDMSSKIKELNIKSPDGNELTDAQQFNLMFQTYLGPVKSEYNVVYLRPETAQAMFVDFRNVLDTARKRIPFGIAQIGKAFRNEITPGNFIFRTREFEQMEIEYFIPVPQSDEDWQKHFEMWRQLMLEWMEKDLGLDMTKVHELEVAVEDRAHYSKRTIDFEYEFPFGTKELYGLAYRTDFDLKNHQEASGMSMKYRDPDTNEEYIPHVIEPTWGVDRTIMAVLANAYKVIGEGDKQREVMQIKPSIAPFKVAVFPLLGNKPDLIEQARKVYLDLKQNFMVAWDDRGNIGKRYASQDEIGTPFCVTVDFQTLTDDTVTVRDRDTAQQSRISISDLKEYVYNKIDLS